MSSLERNDPSVIDDKARPFFPATLSSSGYTSTCMYDFNFNSKYYKCGKKAGNTFLLNGKINKIRQISAPGKLPCYKTFHDDYPVSASP